MSQPYYSEYSQPYYTPDSYDSVNTMHSPIQPSQSQSHASGYEDQQYPQYQNEYYGGDVAPGAVDDSSTLLQTYTYSDANYAPDNTGTYNSSYNSAPNQTVPQHPDSGVPQYGDDASGQTWTGPDPHPDQVYNQRRDSCASMSTDTGDWYSHDGANSGQYDYTQQAVEQDHSNYQYQQQQQQYQQQQQQYQQQQQQQQYQQQQQQQQYQQQQQDMNFGMYSPTQYTRTQELAQNAPYDTQWAPATTMVPKGGLEAPYGTLPIREPQAQYEAPHQRRSSDAYQSFDNGSFGHHVHASPSTQSQLPPNKSPSRSHTSPEDSDEQSEADLYIQQRQAAGYQHGLQVKHELKYQQSDDFQRFEATRRRQSSFTAEQGDNYAAAQDAHHHQGHSGHHYRQDSSSSEHSHRLAPAPIVPSQAHERVLPLPQASPEVEEKKDAPPKKPALACLFCRKRKIACGPPAPDNPDRTCNQCARRKQACEYPTESRRGIRKTPKEPAPEEPTVHKFVHGDATSHEATGAIRTPRGRRKRTE